jgi:hypothetical protein
MVSVTVALGLTFVPLRLAIKPDATYVVKLTSELNPSTPVTVISEVSEAPGRIVREAGVAETVKSAATFVKSMVACLKWGVFVFPFVWLK